MGNSFDDSGLKRLQKNLQQLNAIQDVSFAELFNSEFMTSQTNYSSFEALAEASSFDVKSAEDLKAIPDDQWDAFIRKATRFDSWHEMQKEAAVQRIRRQLLNGLG